MDKPKIQIVIADNNKDFCNILNEYLSCQEDIVVTGIANNGVEALKLIEEKKPDLVLIDIIMPIIGGLDVLEKLNTTYLYRVPRIIILSAISRKKTFQKAISLGADYYVVKPFNIEELIERIRQMLNSTTCSDNIRKPINNIYKDSQAVAIIV